MRRRRESFVPSIPSIFRNLFFFLSLSLSSKRMEEGRDLRSVLQSKRYLRVSWSRYTPFPLPVCSNCDHFALRNPSLIGSNYPPTGDRDRFERIAKPTFDWSREKERKEKKKAMGRKVVSFERELKIEEGKTNVGPRVGKQ